MGALLNAREQTMLNQDEKSEVLGQLFPAANLHQEYPHLFTVPQAKWVVRNRAKNGFESVTIKMGRRLFVDRELLPAWVDTQREAGQ